MEKNYHRHGKLGDNTRYLRKTCGWSQTEFGEKLGIKKSAVSKHEKGEGIPKTDVLFDIADLFRISIIVSNESISMTTTDF